MYISWSQLFAVSRVVSWQNEVNFRWNCCKVVTCVLCVVQIRSNHQHSTFNNFDQRLCKRTNRKPINNCNIIHYNHIDYKLCNKLWLWIRTVARYGWKVAMVIIACESDESSLWDVRETKLESDEENVRASSNWYSPILEFFSLEYKSINSPWKIMLNMWEPLFISFWFHLRHDCIYISFSSLPSTFVFITSHNIVSLSFQYSHCSWSSRGEKRW